MAGRRCNDNPEQRTRRTGNQEDESISGSEDESDGVAAEEFGNEEVHVSSSSEGEGDEEEAEDRLYEARYTRVDRPRQPKDV